MSLRAAVVDGLARSRPSTPCIRSLAVLLAAISLAGIQAARADNATAILQKMTSLYANAHTYEGTVTVHSSGKSPQNGQAYSVTSTQHVRYKSPNLIEANITLSGTGAAARAGQSGQMVVSDGKNLFRYATAMKQYMKLQAPPKLTLLQVLSLPSFDKGTSKVVGSSTVNGHTAYEVEYKPGMPTLPANMPAKQKEQIQANFKQMKPIRLTIDKQNGQLLRMSMGPNKVAFAGQTFNGSIPASAFAFHPPVGAKEFTMPRGPGMPGAPGAPGAPPTPPGGGRRP